MIAQLQRRILQRVWDAKGAEAWTQAVDDSVVRPGYGPNAVAAREASETKRDSEKDAEVRVRPTGTDAFFTGVLSLSRIEGTRYPFNRTALGARDAEPNPAFQRGGSV